MASTSINDSLIPNNPLPARAPQANPIYLIDPSLQMSTMFIERDKYNKLRMIGSILIDIALTTLSIIIINNGCEYASDSSGIMTWNIQWMVYFFAKSIYHSIVSLQLFSKSKQLELCFKIGQLKTPQENETFLEYFNLPENNKFRLATRNRLDKQFFSFYYQRNKILKFGYYVKALATLVYVIYGYVELFQSPSVDILADKHYYEYPDCQVYIAYYSWVTEIIVLVGNIAIFDFLLFIILCNKQQRLNDHQGDYDNLIYFLFVLAIPIFIFYYAPVYIYKKIKQHRFVNKTMSTFEQVSYSNTAIQGDNHDCAICRMTYVIDEEITILPCSKLHHFHKTCISAWFEINTKCPLCRHDFTEQLLQLNRGEQQ